VPEGGSKLRTLWFDSSGNRFRRWCIVLPGCILRTHTAAPAAIPTTRGRPESARQFQPKRPSGTSPYAKVIPTFAQGPSRTETNAFPSGTQEDSMKRFVSFCAVLSLALWLSPAVYAQASQVVPGTQVRLTLVNGLSTSVAHSGDPFTAVIAEPVFSGNEMILPAGAKVHGTITTVERPKLFSMFRGGASMNLAFNSIEVESRIFPVKMSILSIYNGGADAAKPRKDLKTVEGEEVKQNHDIKSDVMTVAIGTAGGSAVGLLFSNVMRGTIYGLVGGGVYIAARKGKEVDLPAQTGITVRMDSTVALPPALMHNASNTSSGN
jgi:hypothetical protein